MSTFPNITFLRIKALVDARDVDGAYSALKEVYETYARSGSPVAKEYVELHLLLMRLESEAT